jgi:hypothetical protein
MRGTTRRPSPWKRPARAAAARVSQASPTLAGVSGHLGILAVPVKDKLLIALVEADSAAACSAGPDP